jgi:hypothetical protein
LRPVLQGQRLVNSIHRARSCNAYCAGFAKQKTVASLGVNLERLPLRSRPAGSTPPATALHRQIVRRTFVLK